MAKVEAHTPLSTEDRDALLSLPHKVTAIEAGRYIFREGDCGTNCTVILSGFACRHKLLPDGSRQILAIHMRGDGIDLQNALMVVMEHNVQALTPIEAAMIPATAVGDLVTVRPAVARALWIETLVDASIQREWTVNIGRRDSRARVAHFLCELGTKVNAAGLGARDEYSLPLTQEQLADATGLTSVHVNRVLRSLAAEGLIRRQRRDLAITSWDRLADLGQFTPDYLHPAQTTMAP